jgi:hypothetical protein
MSNDLVVVASASLDTFEDCLKAAAALQEGDDKGVIAILSRAAALWISDIQADVLVKKLAAASGIGRRPITALWKKLAEKAAKEKEAAEAQERARRAAEYAAQRQQAQDEQRRRLWQSCAMIAESPILLQGMEAVAHLAGIVGEGAAIRALYLSYNSRFLDGGSVRLLRTGASAAGKNAVVEKTLIFIPKDEVVQISGSSPKALIYYGGDDNPDALKYKIVYCPEAVILAKKPSEVDNEFAVMFRTLLSEGCVVYRTVVVDPVTGRKETVTVVKNGPIVPILTTAKDVDHELKTRTLVQDTDESGAQTVEIVRRALSQPKGPLNLQSWLDFQHLLKMDAPYRVVIPFSETVFAAFQKWRPGFLETSALRMRRDVHSFLSAVKASAVTHRFQRETTEDGAIVATLDDYRHVHEAFDQGLASVHDASDSQISENTLAAIEAVEAMMGETDFGSVKVTARELAKRLRVGSSSTAWTRLMAAVDCGALEWDETMSGGRGKARYFRVVRTAKDIRTAPGKGVFPPVDVVREICFSGAGGPESAEQTNKRPFERKKL